MLSRIAESLYWIGRYVERAEDTARLLDVHYHLLVEDRHASERAVCAALLGAMGVTEDALDEEPTAAAVTALLAEDREFPGSINASFASAWTNARGAPRVVVVGDLGDAQLGVPGAAAPDARWPRGRRATTSTAG